jgi:hypothetical protein
MAVVFPEPRNPLNTANFFIDVGPPVIKRQKVFEIPGLFCVPASIITQKHPGFNRKEIRTDFSDLQGGD